MYQTMKRGKKRFKVELWESERGFGQKLFCTEYFSEFEEAQKFYEAENSKNTKKEVPDYYIYARKPEINQ